MTDAEISKALRLLSLTLEDISAIRFGGLEALKAKAKRGYKKAAAKLHPDVNGGDAGKTADFVLMNTFMREVAGMQPPPVLQKRTVKHRMSIKLRGVRNANG